MFGFHMIPPEFFFLVCFIQKSTHANQSGSQPQLASTTNIHQPYGHMMPYGLWQCHFMANLHNLSALHRGSGWCHAMADDTDEAMVMYQ
jgi:hypothetical protein